MSKGNSTMGWVLGLGALAMAGIAYFKKKGGTPASAEASFDVTDLSISLADFGNLKFLDATLPPYMSYDLVVNCTNKSAKGVPCKKMVIEISDGTKQITSLEAVDKDGLDVAYFKPKMTSQSTIGIISEVFRTFELLDMTLAKFQVLMKKGVIADTSGLMLSWIFGGMGNYRTVRGAWDQVKPSFNSALKFQKTLTVKCTAYLYDESGNTFSTSTTKQFEI